MIKDLAIYTPFRQLLQIDLAAPNSSAKVKKMEDVALVLRFFARSVGRYKSMKKGFKQFLSDEMLRMNSLDETAFVSMREKFTKTMALILAEFGDKAFAKYRYEAGKYSLMSNFNAAVYDALAVAIADEINLDQPVLSRSVAKRFKKLFADSNFFQSVEGSVNDLNKIDTRIVAVKQILR